MAVPDFRDWPRHLTGDDMAAALAAAGVLWARGGYYPFPDDEYWMVEKLETAMKGSEIVDWDEPYFFEGNYERQTSGTLLASAWNTAIRPHGRGFRLKLRVHPSRAVWYVRQLSNPKTRIGNTFLHLDPPSTYVDWDWPIRVGIVSDLLSRLMESALRELIQEVNPWLEPLITFVDLNGSAPVADFLFFAEGSSLLDTLRRSPTAIRANCLFLTRTFPEQWEQLEGAIQECLVLTQAKGIVVAAFDSLEPGPWFPEVVRELSHNVPLDLAIRSAAERCGERGNALVASSKTLLDRMRLSIVAETLGRRLAQTSLPGLEIDERMSLHLSMPPGQHHPTKVALHLKENLNRFLYYAESEEATTLSRLSREIQAGKTLGEPLDYAAEQRSLQFHLYSRRDPYRDRFPLSDEPLLARVPYTLDIRIGPRDERWMSLNRPFPEQELPPSEGGHLLTVVFSEPFSVPQPMISTLVLPPEGPSSICRFKFSPSAERQVFEGRVIVLHENRVLQSALLRALVEDRQTLPVRRRAGTRGKERSGKKESEPLKGVEFIVEAAVRSFTSLGARRDSAAAFLLNHTVDGDATATRVAGYRASLISLKGVEKAIEAVEDVWNKCDWEHLKYDSLESDETLELFRTLADHGRLLYDALVDDQQLADRLRSEPRIQVIAARVDAHLPIEMCYSRNPPAKNARLCSTAAKALQEGRCDGCNERTGPEDEVICPLAFWGLSKVIEWHRFDVRDQVAMGNADFALQSEPTARNSRLAPLARLLLATSAKIPGIEVSKLQTNVHLLNNAKPHRVTSWRQWTDAIQTDEPATLLLMVHTAHVRNLPSMEINTELLDPPYVDVKHVRRQGGSPPLVLLLGCRTGVGPVAFQSLPAQFCRKGAAIVVSTMAELLDEHAPRLAAFILAELAKPTDGERAFGDVMLNVKRACLAQGLPIAMALLCYGDADWWV